MNFTFWQEVFVAVSSSAFTAVLLYAIFRMTINHFLGKELAKFKSSLDEKLAEHKVRFSVLHEKRAEVLGELYSRMIEFYGEVKNLLSPIEMEGDPSKQERIALVNGKIEDFMSYFRRNRIYLPGPLCKQIEEVYTQIRDTGSDFAMFIAIPPEDTDEKRERRETWKRSWKEITEKVPDALEKLEREFRKLVEV